MKFFYSFWLILGLSFPVLNWASNIISPSLDSQSIQTRDFYKHPETSKDFNETWSYSLFFSNGTKAYINFASLPIPSQGRKIGCDLSFWNPKWKNPSVGRQYPPERFIEQKEKNRITIKEEYFMENLPGKGHRVFFSADKGGRFFVDITFTSAIPGIVPGKGIWKIGSAQFAQFIHIPYGKVSGRIGFNEDTIAVSGYGYMDHVYQSVSTIDFVNRSLSFSMPYSNEMFAGRLSISKEGTTLGYGVYIQNGKPEILIPKQILEKDKNYSGKTFPKNELKITWASSAPDLILNTSKIQQKFSILNNFDGWFAKKAAKLLMGGEVWFYRGRSYQNKNAIDWSLTGL